MQLPRNNFKHALAAGERQIGLWSAMCSPIGTEIIGYSGFDWILLDMEHSPNELPGIVAQLQVLNASQSSAIVRSPWNDMVMIKRILDVGAQSIMFPYIQNADEARQAVESTHYPGRGVRGVAAGSRASNYGRVKDYLLKASEEICVLLQVETGEAIEELENIAAVDGVNGIFIGPADLSASMGHLGNPNHEDVQAAIKGVAETLARLGMPSGILAADEDVARRYIEWGYNFVAIGSDTGLLAKAADSLCIRFKS